MSEAEKARIRVAIQRRELEAGIERMNEEGEWRRLPGIERL
ncbi:MULTISPECIES: hypothetical protein [unclassified Tsukamurella]